MRDRGAVGVVSGTQILFHPALVAQLQGVVDIAVNVGNGVRTAIERGPGGEVHLIPVCRTHNVRGVCPYIIGGCGHQSREVAGKDARAVAIIRVAVADRGIVRGAPAHAAGCHGGHRHRMPHCRLPLP